MKSICLTCKHRHNYYKKPLTNKEAWCTKYGKLVVGKKGCIDFELKLTR